MFKRQRQVLTPIALAPVPRRRPEAPALTPSEAHALRRSTSLTAAQSHSLGVGYSTRSR
ncbi:MAG: hypothetical protein QOE11_2035 [Solirubrobacteraceae bacterium]|jgi:hypothetical protein|nr:hypothetical protein [Solirubrobacteraceae bacterium]